EALGGARRAAQRLERAAALPGGNPGMAEVQDDARHVEVRQRRTAGAGGNLRLRATAAAVSEGRQSAGAAVRGVQPGRAAPGDEYDADGEILCGTRGELGHNRGARA